jgi:hypothetical protein
MRQGLEKIPDLDFLLSFLVTSISSFVSHFSPKSSQYQYLSALSSQDATSADLSSLAWNTISLSVYHRRNIIYRVMEEKGVEFIGSDVGQQNGDQNGDQIRAKSRECLISGCAKAQTKQEEKKDFEISQRQLNLRRTTAGPYMNGA